MLQHEIDAHVSRYHEVPTHTDAGVPLAPTRFTITYRDMEPGQDDVRRNVTDVYGIPMGASHADVALIYARSMSERFPTCEYAVFDQREGDHLAHYYWTGDHSLRSNPRP